MTTEEKALAYDKALEKAKQVYNTPYTAHWDIMKDLIVHLFPEFRESEGERVRKRIIDLIDMVYAKTMSFITPQEFEEMIAWLKEQGQVKESSEIQNENKTCEENADSLTRNNEQKPTEDIDADKASVEYMNYRKSCGITDPIMLNEIEEAYYEGAIRQKPAEKKELKKSEQKTTEIPFGAKDSDLQEETYYIPKGFHAEIDGDKIVIKKGEQKPAEWSEEDNFIINELVSFLENGEVKLQHDLNIYAGWLKSLTPNKRWKPTDEQMEVLLKYAEQNNQDGSVLISLYQDLKKLKD